MKTIELVELIELKELSTELSRAIRFAEAKGGLTKPGVNMSGNFSKYFDEYLRQELSETILTMCINSLKAKKLEVDEEIRLTIKDWAG